MKQIDLEQSLMSFKKMFGQIQDENITKFTLNISCIKHVSIYFFIILSKDAWEHMKLIPYTPTFTKTFNTVNHWLC